MKAGKRRPPRDREEESADERDRRDELFHLLYPHAKRAAGVRSSAWGSRYADVDSADFEQEALLDVWNALERYDDSRGAPRTFAERIVSNSIASFLRRARAGKRTQSADYETLLESSRPRVFARLELRLDIDRVLAALPGRERMVARLLEEDGPAEIARELDIPRSAIYRSIELIRESFRKAGLG
jgi:RNA polymerase sigma factor (sigma-70 family)